MRTKKVEIASVHDVAEVASEPAAPAPAAVEFEVAFRFQKRENAESFIAKTKTLGYDNSELREV